MEILIVLIIGAIAGWLGSVIMTGQGFGLIANIVIGIVGSFIGNFLLAQVGVFEPGLIGTIITATFGAVVLLFIVGIIKRA